MKGKGGEMGGEGTKGAGGQEGGGEEGRGLDWAKLHPEYTALAKYWIPIRNSDSEWSFLFPGRGPALQGGGS